MQQPAARSKAILSSDTPSVFGHIRCKLCNTKLYYSCYSELHALLTQFMSKQSTLEEERHSILSNPWYIHVGNLILHPTSFNNASIPVGHCCSFTSTIEKHPPGVGITLPKNSSHHLPKECFSTGSSRIRIVNTCLTK